jgi:hypothetical protein
MITIDAILAKKLLLSKPQQKFLYTLFQTMLTIPCRTNFLSLSRYSSLSEKTFRRWFSRGIELLPLNIELLHSSFKKINQRQWIIAIDSVILEKSGKKTYGLCKLWSSTAKSVIKGMEFHCISLINIAAQTAFPLTAKQIISKKDENKIAGYLKQLESVKENLLAHSIYIVADGFYAKKHFIDGVTEMKFELISKLRCDADLRYLYEGEQKKGRGRKRKYQGKVNPNKKKGFKYVDTQANYKIFEGLFYSVRFNRNIKVVKLEEKGSGDVTLLFATDLKLSARTITKYYRLRFQIEFVFRDARQHTGLNHCQSIKEKSLETHVNASLTALTIAKLDLLIKNNFDAALPISIHDYKQRQTNAFVAEFIFSNLAIDRTSKKIKALTEKVLNIGCISYSKAA